MSMSTIALPGSGKATSQLGFGCAYLLGPGLDSAASRRLLDAAWAAGIRHFDVAPLYGQGHSEALLGEFLKAHPDASVTTKFGMIPPTFAQRLVAVAQRRVPGLLKSYRRKEKAVFNAAECRASLEQSLQHLGRDHIDLLLLHEAQVGDLVHDDLLAFLEQQRQAGTIGDFGIGGEYTAIPPLYAQRRPFCRVLQMEWSIFGPTLEIPDSYRVHYRTFAKPASALATLFEKDPALLRRWSETVEAELDKPPVLSRLLLKASLDAWPGSLTLFSTRREQHISDNAAVAADLSLTAPAARLAILVREEGAALGASLYS